MAIASTVATSQAVMSAYDVTTIINNINTLYTNVINQFVSISLGMLALFGVVLPLVFAYFQKRKIKADQITLTEKIEKEIAVAKELLTEEMKRELGNEKTLILQEIEKMKKEMKLEIKKISAGANAKAHHLQANSNIADKNFSGAFIDAATAINNYAISDDEGNLIRAADTLMLKLIIPFLVKSDFIDEELEKEFKSICETIESKNVNGRYGDCLDALKKAFKVALLREDKKV